MQYSTLIAQIEADIYSNGAELITGDILQTVLKRMVSAWASAGAAYGGTISPDTVVPLNLDQATVYLALTAGTYEHFLDGEGDPIETTGPALVIYDGGPALIFSKTDLPSGGSGATVITGGPGDSLVVTLPKGDEGIKASYRIDMTAKYTGGSEVRYIGSLIIEANELAMQVAHGYYYGDDMAEILSEVAIWKDDPEIYPDEQGFYLLLTMQSDLDEVIFSVSSLDGQPVDAVASNEDEKVKVSDATITTVGGGDGKIGVISQTQTWSGSGSNPRTYVMSNPVTGLIPQANIDLFVAAGAVYNESTGYFELNGLTDISYEEMRKIYDASGAARSNFRTRESQFAYCEARTLLPIIQPYMTAFPTQITTMIYNSECESVGFYALGNPGQPFNVASQGLTNLANSCDKLKKFVGIINVSSVTNANSAVTPFTNCYSLEDISLKGIKVSVAFSNSPNLSKASLLYMINNEASTSAITITLHASVYAKCQSGGEWYSDISTALAAHTNVTLANA